MFLPSFTGFVNITVNGNFNVTDVSQVILSSNDYRKYAKFSNYGTQTIWLQYGSAAIPNRGIKLGINATLIIAGYELYCGAIYAVSNSPTTIDILEGV